MARRKQEQTATSQYQTLTPTFKPHAANLQHNKH